MPLKFTLSFRKAALTRIRSFSIHRADGQYHHAVVQMCTAPRAARIDLPRLV